ncbi:MAG: tRNA dihydrouridine synthase DusB [Gammaproteobacteria bacterium RBG_16_51_14]|nr:MAG: tRNA dihydrouridine synthase DusB [Gammaproteobacteria bacterium RBG_16_51_14]
MVIGPYKLKNNILLAPMAGVTDSPFRQLCRELGAGLAVSEMVMANPSLWKSRKTQNRLKALDEQRPRVVQIAGANPDVMAEAARLNVDHGADMIDINMGCPAKKVSNAMAGSALLRDELLVARILRSVVVAVAVPVTLKIRTGWDMEHRNAHRIARIAEDSGIQALTVHGRTRACRFNGQAEHRTVAEIKSVLSIPVIANGDIDSPQQAAYVLRSTAVDGIMIGRAALGNPWIFRETAYFLATGRLMAVPGTREIRATLLRHVRGLHEFYGAYAGIRMARKHIGWYCRNQTNARAFQALVNQANTANEQIRLIQGFFPDPQELAA